MLEHQKKVLSSVSEDKSLFRKELLKSMAWLDSHEVIELRRWVRENFFNKHADVINDVLFPKYKYVS